MSDREIDALLGQPEIGVLCTVDSRGRPEGTPIWFEHADGSVRILVNGDSRKARNIRENPHVSLTVDTRRAPYRGVLLRGTASLSGPDPELRRLLATRYLGEKVGRSYIESTLELDSADVLVTMAVSSRTSWDYSKGE